MTVGLAFLRSVIDNGSRQALREVPRDMFREEEHPAYDFVIRHYRTHGTLPDTETAFNHGIRLVNAPEPVTYYVERLRQRAEHTTISNRCPEIMRAIQTGDYDGARGLVRTMNSELSHVATEGDVETVVETIATLRERMQELRMSGGTNFVTLGWEPLDDATGGAEPGDVVTLVARPGIGKTYSIVHMALCAWRAGHSVLFVTNEMTKLQIARRIVAIEAQLDPEQIRRGLLSDWADEAVQEVARQFGQGAPFRMVQGNFEKTTGDVDSLMQEFTPDIVFIDASYLMKPERPAFNQKRHELLTDVGNEIKGIASRRNRPIVQTVQFNREMKGRSTEPDLAHIAGSDVVGQVSSIVIAAMKGEGQHENTQRRYKLLKVREGETGAEFKTNFLFNPPNFDFIPEQNQDDGPAPATQDPSWMM